jgi:hypothetical protein
MGEFNKSQGPWTAGSGWTLATGAYGASGCSGNGCVALDIEYDLNATGGSQDATAVIANVDNGFIVEHWVEAASTSRHKVIDAQ